jgi:hypothetical protein
VLDRHERQKLVIVEKYHHWRPNKRWAAFFDYGDHKMKSSSANILIVVGGCLIIAPLAFLYLSYRLIAQVLSELVVHGSQWDKVNFHPTPPEYYVPLCLIIGAICIGVGMFLSWRDRGNVSGAKPQSPNLS